MAETLNPDGTPIYLGEIVLSTPGLTGQAELYLPGVPGMRGPEETAQQFADALAATQFSEQLTVEITGESELDTNGGTRAGGGGDDITIQVPGPGTDFAQVLLYTAEDGTQTWHLPDDIPAEAGAVRTRGADSRTYHIPRTVMPAPGGGSGTRGLIVAVGKKVLKVLVFPLVEKGVEIVAEKVAERWEASHRPYRLRTFTPDDYSSPDGRELGDADWVTLGSGRSLLFVHGTFSRSHTGFGGLPRAVMTELHERYGDRVFAFDHPTLASSPTDNARWLAKTLPSGLAIDADLITHSRGGLVAREICEYADQLGLSGRLNVQRLVMVAAPNAGTALAAVTHWKAFIDRVTNLLQFVPDNPVTDTMDAVLTLLKHVVLGAVGGLDGLMSMDPDGSYLQTRLNPPTVLPHGRYFAVASDYQPPPGSPLLQVARDGLTDLVFGLAQNDLIVPTDGVYTVPGARGFPIPAPLVFAPAAGVEHSSYMARELFTSQLLRWLAPST
jgi:hypothetical protein